MLINTKYGAIVHRHKVMLSIIVLYSLDRTLVRSIMYDLSNSLGLV